MWVASTVTHGSLLFGPQRGKDRYGTLRPPVSRACKIKAGASSRQRGGLAYPDAHHPRPPPQMIRVAQSPGSHGNPGEEWGLEALTLKQFK